MAKRARTFRGPDGTDWRIEVRAPSSSNAMVVFHHPVGGTSRLNRYAWLQIGGPEARDVTGRADKRKVLESLTDDSLALLFRRSMPITTAAPGPNLATG
jgi:hypothetical protein